MTKPSFDASRSRIRSKFALIWGEARLRKSKPPMTCTHVEICDANFSKRHDVKCGDLTLLTDCQNEE